LNQDAIGRGSRFLRSYTRATKRRAHRRSNSAWSGCLNPASTATRIAPRFPLITSSGFDPSVTDYILEAPAKCPNCRGEILEKTLIEPA